MKPNENGSNSSENLMGAFAEIMTAASSMFSVYTAFKDAGFTEQQAMQIVLEIMRGATSK